MTEYRLLLLTFNQNNTASNIVGHQFSVWANMHGGLHSALKAEDAGSSPAAFAGL
jgi:hypothetical protein